METVCKTYNTRRKRKSLEPDPKSRVDWKRTKKDSISNILDSNESLTSEEEEPEETGEESDDSCPTDESEDQPDEEDCEEGRIRKPRLKSRSAMIASESSSDSDGPGEKGNVKRTCVINEDDSDEAAEASGDEETKAHVKKQKRLEALEQLAKRRRSRNRTTSREAPEESPDDTYTPLTPETLDESEDSDDMSAFIVEDEGYKEPGYKELFRKHHLSLSTPQDLSSHLQKVIKAFLINIIDKKFLTTLYQGERKKRYAKDMLRSLNYLDERIVVPRLEKLTTSCRWSKRYKERINCYPNLYVKRIPAEKMSCEACDLRRYCGYMVTLSGQEYNNETLENEDFMPDDKQILVMGTTCAGRSEVYHQLRHYKYCLYQRCIPFIDETKEESANEIVELALSKMEEEDFLRLELQCLEGYLNEADDFQEEDKESLLS
ncbi:coiled-coil domain-containing protein 82 [Bufo bufo]|uniref:coiled-coil domain-containing protein 82 n=1 Tax=Bufo bufo TaxID=8384 RepID=UPI001ABE63AB|nr:coiled-coil domain-containing protein 82 [Bufo bufo]